MHGTQRLQPYAESNNMRKSEQRWSSLLRTPAPQLASWCSSAEADVERSWANRCSRAEITNLKLVALSLRTNMHP